MKKLRKQKKKARRLKRKLAEARNKANEEREAAERRLAAQQQQRQELEDKLHEQAVSHRAASAKKEKAKKVAEAARQEKEEENRELQQSEAAARAEADALRRKQKATKTKKKKAAEGRGSPFDDTEHDKILNPHKYKKPVKAKKPKKEQSEIEKRAERAAIQKAEKDSRQARSASKKAKQDAVSKYFDSIRDPDHLWKGAVDALMPEPKVPNLKFVTRNGHITDDAIHAAASRTGAWNSAVQAMHPNGGEHDATSIKNQLNQAKLKHPELDTNAVMKQLRKSQRSQASAELAKVAGGIGFAVDW